MKHDLRVTLLLLLIFLATQVTGLLLLNKGMDIDVSYNETTNETMTTIIREDVIFEPPDIKGLSAFTYVVSSILIGTLLVLVLMKFRLNKLWKAWFFLAVGLTISVAFDVLIDWKAAVAIGFFLAYLKIARSNIITQNLTEVLMYSGLAIILVPLFDIVWITALLLAVSVYDIFAVFKSKHMVKMAQFQAKSKLFAGILIPYKKSGLNIKVSASVPKNLSSKKVRSAILGGGDIAFPLLFSGTVMTELLMRFSQEGLSKPLAFFATMPIPITVGLALFGLLVYGKKDRFYPAMPVVTAGCLLGYGIVLLLMPYIM